MVTGSILGTGCTSFIKPIERVGFKGLCMLDGPTAVNRNELVSVFPGGVTVAATWDKDHFENRAKAIGKEFRWKGAHIALGYVISSFFLNVMTLFGICLLMVRMGLGRLLDRWEDILWAGETGRVSRRILI